MVRSMYSGVSGLRSHQTRMDTIGNNIANVNTYGFKSGRTTFRDIYYQSLNSASQPTAAMGGVNPSSVGYGSKVGSVDLMMGRSTFTMTDQTMDLAIDGDGFFQVQDGNGNTYYTRAGMLNFDAAGNLVDMQGNYVLGVNGDPTGREPASERITVNLNPVQPQPSTVTASINGLSYSVTATNDTTDGNLNFNFTTDSSLADNETMAAIGTSGIIIKMHPDNTYSSWDEFNEAINKAITAANGGEAHPAGDFNVKFEGDPIDDPFNNAPLTATNITSTNYGIDKGSVKFGATSTNKSGLTPSGTVGNTFGQDFTSDPPTVASFTTTYDATTPKWDIQMVIDGVTYSASVDSTKNSTGKVKLYAGNGDENDYIEMSRPSFDRMSDLWSAEQADVPAVPGVAAEFNVDLGATYGNLGSSPMADGTTVRFNNITYNVTDAAILADTGVTPADANDRLDWLIGKIQADNSANFNIAVTGQTFTMVAKTAGAQDAPPLDIGGPDATSVTTTITGVDAVPAHKPPPAAGDGFAYTSADLGNPTVKASGPSKSVGLAGTSFALRNGTAGGPQTIADMTGISIAPNGIITGWDAVGDEVVIGRIDIVTFANPAGLNQAGSSNYTVSANSGEPILNQPGSNGAGQLVSTSLELSNVDLSREFSDMITTQRGYQANSRIITVSDTMLEELINLKR